MKIAEISGRLKSEILNLVFPENMYCLCCGDAMEPSRVHGICDACAARIDWNTSNPFREESFAFDDLWPCCRYGAYPRRIISGMKLGSKPYAAGSVGLLLAERLEMTGEKDVVIVPVPMYAQKQQQRGFNQAELLARAAAEKLGLPFLAKALVKTKPTKSMRLSSGDERRQLQGDAFELSEGAAEAICGKHVVLVDDVVTTGSTADACAKILKEGGAVRVSVLCFASSYGYKRLDTDGDNDVE